MTDEVMSFTFPKILSYFLGVRNVLKASDMSFDSELSLKSVQKPIQIFHAQDDNVIPVRLARKLYKELEKNGNNVRYKEFPAKDGLSHAGICLSKELPYLISDFVENVV